jgi:two-component system C4-dicarboxylate transport sensor histidine kinase DctB
MAERMGHITGELKRFARKSTGQQQAVAIRSAIANALFLMEQRIRRDRVDVQMNLGEEELRARCDQNRLEQVLVNLIGNAIDAVGEVAQGPRRLELKAWREGDRGDQVVLQVADNGPGLPQQVQERLFEPFLTTKAPGVGLGLGLTISASTVREFGGELKGENRPQGGAVFTLRLPATTEEDHA